MGILGSPGKVGILGRPGKVGILGKAGKALNTCRLARTRQDEGGTIKGGRKWYDGHYESGTKIECIFSGIKMSEIGHLFENGDGYSEICHGCFFN